jgi:hypothetical protein
VTLDRKRGTAVAKVIVNTAGRAVLTGKKVLTARGTTTGAATLELPVKVKPGYRAALRKKGRLRVQVTVTFTATTGGTVTATRPITLVRRR